MYTSLLKAQSSAGGEQNNQKTSFQIHEPWSAAYDIRSDIVMLYGMDDTFNQRAASWRKHGYIVQFMTGIAWGNYQDYFLGRYDGKKHWEEGQVQRNGEIIGHGKNVPYIVPTESYLTYMKTLIKKVINAGITTIYLEEPEFWTRAGYSKSFKQEWKTYYGFDWMAPHTSPEATYLASKLKYHLYYHALNEIFTYAKNYGQRHGKEIKCFVPTHSLINYSSWQIVSPEASLAGLKNMDGYIAQVWTGTAREPNYFNGEKKERVFENAFLEYGTMLSMIKPTGRNIYFLTDPVEDRARSWDDYKRNYQATFSAQLLYPSVDTYEVMPWPQRIYLGKFKLKGNDQPQPLPSDYATQMQIMVNSLNDIPTSDNRLDGSQGIGILLSNSMMFQRFPTHKGYEDPQLSNYYGLVLPLLKRGVPVEMVHMENLGFPASLKDINVLIMSYANMKPMSSDVHRRLAQWVKDGGVLIYYGRDDDPFQQVREWWNTGDYHYKTPSTHLFDLMGIHPGASKTTQPYTYGKGHVFIVRKDPKELVLDGNKDHNFIRLVQKGYEDYAEAGNFVTKNYFSLQRGLYDIIAVMDESVSSKPVIVKRPVIDLFDATLPILKQKVIKPGEQAYLLDLKRIQDRDTPAVLATAARISDENMTPSSYTFTAKSPSGTDNAMRILLPAQPATVTVTDAGGTETPQTRSMWDAFTHTLLLQFPNSAKGKRVMLRW